jgi:PAS domain S-box-containing protein
VTAPLRLLFLADDPRRAARVLRELQRGFDQVQLSMVADAATFQQALAQADFDITLLDSPLAWIDQAAALRALRHAHPDRPALLLVATADESAALRLLEVGDIDGYAVRTASRLERLTASARAGLAFAHQRRALRELESHVRGLFDTAPIGLFRTTPDGTVLEANDTMLRVLGFPDRRTALAVRTPDLYADPGDRARGLAVIERDGALRNFETRLRRYDGSVIWVELNVQARRGGDGRIVALEGSVTDITARWRAEAALRESEERYRTLAEAARDFIYIIGRDGALEYVNTPGAWALGSTPEALRGRPQMELFPEPVASRHAAALEIVVKSGEPLEAESHDRLGGRDVWLHSSLAPIFDDGGQVRSVLGISRDITARREAEDALRHSEAQLQGVMNSVPDAIFVVSHPDRVIRFVNVTSAEIFGFAPDELVGQNTRCIYQTDEEYAAFGEKLRTALAGGHGRLRTEQIFTRKNGQNFPAELHGSFVTLEGQPTLFISIIRDITERRALEERVRESEKLEAIGRLAGGVAHDFNNMLTAVMGYSSMLLDELAHDARLRADVEEIRKAGERAAALTQQLLAFGRRQLIQPAILDLNQAVRDLEEAIRRLTGPDIELRLRLAEPLGFIRMDPRHLHQMLLAFATHAHDAMPAGGRLTIETADVVIDADAVRDRPGLAPGGYVNLTVTDNGPALDPETLAHLFEPFFEIKGTRQRGGLALATVHGIVRQAGGDIRVQSGIGQGTTFVVHLPIVPTGDTAPLPDVAVAEGVSPQGTILVAEDEDAVRTLARQVLVRAGYTVLVAGDGEQAQQVAERHAGPIDLLLTDVIMPGANGPELADRMSATRPGLKVLFMSGYPGGALDGLGLRRERVSFLPKPFTPDQLLQQVRNALAS